MRLERNISAIESESKMGDNLFSIDVSESVTKESQAEIGNSPIGIENNQFAIREPEFLNSSIERALKNNKESIYVSAIYFGLLVFGITFLSCNTNPDLENNDATSRSDKNVKSTVLEPAQYVKWIQKNGNGLLKEKKIEDITFSAQYKPYQYIACMEERKNTISDTVVKKKVSELEGMQYYDLKIALTDAEGELLKYKLSSANEYDQRVRYFAFAMQNDVKLVEAGDTLPCALFHFERTYDIAPYGKFLLGFANDKNKSIEEKTLLFYDKTFGKGMIKFTFKNKQIDNIPKLKTV